MPAVSKGMPKPIVKMESDESLAGEAGIGKQWDVDSLATNINGGSLNLSIHVNLKAYPGLPPP